MAVSQSVFPKTIAMHCASRQPIRPDAANHDERRPADREGGQHDPEPGRPAADPEDRERERHRDQ